MIGSPVRIQCPKVFEFYEVPLDNMARYKEKAEVLIRLKIAKIKEEKCLKEKQIIRFQEACTEAKIRRKKALLEKCEVQRRLAVAEWRRNKIESVLKYVKDIAAVIERKREETQRKNRAAYKDSPREQELKKDIVTFTKQSRDFICMYKTSVDIMDHLMYRIKKADARAKLAECKAHRLEKTLDKIKYIQELIIKSKKLKESKRHLEIKNKSGLEKAEIVEEKEVMLEERIIELEDQIDHFKRKKQRLSGLLMDYRNGENSSNAILTLLKSNKRSSIP